MAFEYKKVKQKVSVNGEKVDKFIAKVHNPGFVDTKNLASEIEHATTYSEGEVMGVLLSLRDIVKKVISTGRSVKLEGLGILYPTVSAKAVDKLEDCNHKTIKNINIRFRADKELTEALKDVKFRSINGADMPAGDYFDTDSTLI